MNLLELRNEVLARGFNPIVYGARVTQWINDAQSLIARRVDYYVGEAADSFSTVAGTGVYPWPANLARIRSLFDTDRRRELRYVSIRDIDQWPLANGAPSCYALIGENVQLYPTPDGVYNLDLRFWMSPAPLVDDSDTPSIPSDWHWLLWVYGTWRAFQADDDAQEGGYWEQQWNNALSMFTADVKFPDTDGPVQARGMWEGERTPGYGWPLSAGGW